MGTIGDVWILSGHRPAQERCLPAKKQKSKKGLGRMAARAVARSALHCNAPQPATMTAFTAVLRDPKARARTTALLVCYALNMDLVAVCQASLQAVTEYCLRGTDELHVASDGLQALVHFLRATVTLRRGMSYTVPLCNFYDPRVSQLLTYVRRDAHTVTTANTANAVVVHRQLLDEVRRFIGSCIDGHDDTTPFRDVLTAFCILHPPDHVGSAAEHASRLVYLATRWLDLKNSEERRTLASADYATFQACMRQHMARPAVLHMYAAMAQRINDMGGPMYARFIQMVAPVAATCTTLALVQHGDEERCIKVPLPDAVHRSLFTPPMDAHGVEHVVTLLARQALILQAVCDPHDWWQINPCTLAVFSFMQRAILREARQYDLDFLSKFLQHFASHVRMQTQSRA